MASQKTILYDDNCPLCCWYTDAFVQTGLLEAEGRQSFTDIELETLTEQLDLARSKDEIPLLDDQGGATLYGIDSLLYLLGQRWPWMPKVAGLTPIDWFLRRLYKLISYNRRVIVAKPTPANAFDCSPQFNYFYRYVYLAMALMVGGSGLWGYWVTYAKPIVSVSLLLLFLVVVLLAFRQPKREAMINYLGVMLTPLIPGGILLWLAVVMPAVSTLLGGLAIGVCITMWWRRYPVANL